MNETLKSCQNKRSKILQELKEKHVFYSDLIKRNRFDIGHANYCNKDSHRRCGAIWGHADILKEIISRIWWWFTNNQPIDVNVSTKPKLQSILEQIKKQRKQAYWEENEIEDAEYYWLIHIINRCKDLSEVTQNMPKWPNR
jgi:hypothetical protein